MRDRKVKSIEEIKTELSDEDKDYFKNLINSGRIFKAYQECCKRTGAAWYQIGSLFLDISEKYKEEDEIFKLYNKRFGIDDADYWHELCEKRNNILDNRRKEIEEIEKTISGMPVVKTNGDNYFYTYLYKCDSCENDIVIKTSESRYGYVGEFKCPLCGIEHTVTMKDGEPTHLFMGTNNANLLYYKV